MARLYRGCRFGHHPGRMQLHHSALFSSIHKRGAGLGPAIAFLYSGPAINILAIILTARILGIEMGIARVVGAVVFSIVIGSVMSLIYRKEERAKREAQLNFPDVPEERPMWQTAFHLFTLDRKSVV